MIYIVGAYCDEHGKAVEWRCRGPDREGDQAIRLAQFEPGICSAPGDSEKQSCWPKSRYRFATETG